MKKALTLPERLAEEEQDEDLTRLLESIKKDLSRSRSFMSKAYDSWDRNLDTYRSVRVEDPDDKRSKIRREPTKQTVPLSYAQINTFVTYLVLLYTQDQIFRGCTSGVEDAPLAEVYDKVIEREVRENQFVVVLVEFLLNVARMNLGVLKTSWEEERFVPPTGGEGLDFEMEDGGMLSMLGAEAEEVVVREGSKVANVSPYNFFPDTRLPLTRWREGQFAADETVFHIDDLREWESEGSAFGVDFLTPMDRETWKSRGTTRLEGLDPTGRRGKPDEKDFMVCVTEVQKKLVPKEWGLGESDQRELWLIRVGNDKRILSAQVMEDANMGFTYDVAQLSPDQHTELSDSLSSLIDQLQETATWLMNSRIAAVKKNIEMQLVVHPQAIELADLEARNPFVRMKKSAPMGLGIDKFIQQLKTSDPTAGHFQDLSTTMGLMEQVSGVNGNAMGQFHSGRRSATEARNVAGGAASRMKLIGATIWASALAPCGKRMHVNARQWMSLETFVKIVGDNEDSYLFYETFHRDNWWELVGVEDFFTYDGTSAQEKIYEAQNLQDLAVALMSNPEVAISSGLDLVKVIEEVQRLRGTKNLKKFQLSPDEQLERQQRFIALQGPPQQPPGAVGPAASGGSTEGGGGVPAVGAV